MKNLDLHSELLCVFAKSKKTRRGDYIYCSNKGGTCVATIEYPTGHGSLDCYVDLRKMLDCDERKEK